MTAANDPTADPSNSSAEEVPENEEANASDSMTSGSFEDLDMPPMLLKGLSELGYTAPTDVQRKVFEPVREGNDVIVQSRTGSGKTTAFCAPVLASLDPELKAAQSIALAPTRELAVQVANEATRLSRFMGIKTATIYGGASMQAQMDALAAGAQFIVGTPGRVKDLIRRGHLKMKNVKFAILDEADEMLSMGFWDEVTSILDQIPSERQTLLFSATLPGAIERAAKKYLKDPQRIDLSTDTLNVDTIRHVYHESDDNLSKPRQFLYVLEFHRPQNAIVFCNRRDETDLLTSYLSRFGFRAQALNGDMPQSARERVLKKVKAGELDLMVATDVAARGIDISDLGHVFNYDLPEFDEVYVHRSGRTGRIGKKGVAASLVRGKFITHLATLKRDFGVPFEHIKLPDEKEILWMQAERLAQQLVEEADGVEIEQYRAVAESMLERGDMKEILAFLLRSHYSLKKKATPDRDRDERQAEDGRRESRGRDRDRGRGRGRRDERPRREERPRRDEEDRAPRDGDGDDSGPKSANLYVTLGRDDGLEDMTALIAKLSEMSGVDIGHFTGAGDVRDHSSHVEVDPEVAEQVTSKVHGQPRGGDEDVEEADDDEDGEDRGPRLIKCERAKPRRSRRRGPPRRRD